MSSKLFKFTIFILFALIFVKNSSVQAQSIANNNLSSKQTTKFVNFYAKFRLNVINTDEGKTIKFEIPYQTNASINISDDKGNTLRKYLYDNIYAGNYEILIENGDLPQGNYHLMLKSGENTETMNFTLRQ